MTHLRRLCGLVVLLLGAGTAGLCADAPASSQVRVLSQTVGSDELLLALAEPAQIAALSHLATNPFFSVVSKEASQYPSLKPYADAEAALAYRPTLVLCADYSRSEFVSQIRRSGVRVLVFTKYFTLQDAYDNLRLLARELGAEARAEALIAACERRVAILRQRLAGRRPVRVLAPSVYEVVPGRATTFQDLCDQAGAENLAATLGGLTGHATPPAERMLEWPVEKLVLGGEDLASALAPFLKLAPYRFMASVREGRAVLLRPSLLACVSHRRIDGYELLAKALHPEVFAEEKCP